MSVTILEGDALAVLRTLPSDHFHCVVTSPPYWGLRDYGTGSWEGGDEACDHVSHRIVTGDGMAALGEKYRGGGHKAGAKDGKEIKFRDVCGKCGARRIDQQIGLEETPDAWCARLVEVFREVRRVLRPDGVCWLNIGDSYAGPKGNTAMTGGKSDPARGNAMFGNIGKSQKIPLGMKQKDLVGAPWMLAFALRADGWWLRSEIIWAKPNPMPESVRDRCTKAHEYVFHLSKSATYFWDADAVREPANPASEERYRYRFGGAKNEHLTATETNGAGTRTHPIGNREFDGSRNLRSVWTIATEPLPSIEVDGEKLDHFASFPTALASLCIRAGTSQRGCCPACGAPWARVVEREASVPQRKFYAGADQGKDGRRYMRNGGFYPSAETTDWRPTCSCPPADAEPCRVLDPFGGSGRTALAAEELGRDCTLIELNPNSCAMARAQLERAKARRMIGDAARAPALEGQLRLDL